MTGKTLEEQVQELIVEIQGLKQLLSEADKNIDALAGYTKQNVQSINNMFVESRLTKEVITGLINALGTKNLVTGVELERELTEIAEKSSKKDIEISLKNNEIVKVDEVTEVSIVVHKNKNSQYAYEKSSMIPGCLGKTVGEMIEAPSLDGAKVIYIESEIIEIYDTIQK